MNRNVAALIFGLLIIFSGCQKQMNDQEMQPEDPEITEAVKSDLISARGVDASVLSVETEEGIVTLSGTADNLLTKERASRVASSIKGVRAVVNNINIVSDKSETLVNENIQAALRTDHATENWEIETDVENGIVSLSGTVDSWQEKKLAGTIVKGISGVVGIDNNLVIEYEEDRTDSEIKEEIVSALRWDNRINAALVDVEVNNGNVSLSGSLASFYEKNLARSISYVAGVKEVDFEDIDIKSWLKDDMKRKDFLSDINDADIEKAIMEAIERHPRLSRDSIQISVENNTATLSGTVNSLKKARAAAEVADHTHGVISVENNLDVVNEIVVVADANITDAEIKEDVAGALLRDPFVNSIEIDVSVNDGVVNLEGTADTYFEKFQADEVASRVNGVVEINNDISVDYAEPEYEPSFYDWDVIDDDYDYERKNLADSELEEAIIEELVWSPYITAANIDVEANNGVVTLEGVVLSPYSVSKAIDEAYEAGAINVINKLEYM